MTSPYLASAVQSAYTGSITFVAATVAYAGITPDVTMISGSAVVLTYGITLMLSAIRTYLMRDKNHVEPTEGVVESIVGADDSPWKDPNMVAQAQNLIDEEQLREFFRTRSTRARATFGNPETVLNFPEMARTPRLRQVLKATR